MKMRPLLLLLFAATAVFSPHTGKAQETWKFDPSFQRTPLVVTSESASGVKVLSSGKVLIHTINGSFLSGANGQRIGALIRVDPNTGAIDPTWHPARTVIAAGFLGVAEAPNGKIYYSTSLAGEYASRSTDPAINRLIRLNTDGSRDPTFNSPIFAFPARFLAVQPDGKIIVCSGGVNLNGVPPAGSIVQTARLNTDGTLDTTFRSPNFQLNANDPPASVATGNFFDRGVFGDPVIDPATGKIYFCGTFAFVDGEARKGIVRCNPNGTVDSSFVPTGLVGGTTQISARAMVLQAGGKVVMGGTSLRTAAGGSTRYALLRFENNGALDPSFTLVPTTTSSGSPLFPNYFGPRDIQRLPDGKILTSDIRVLRFLANGALDSDFTPLDYSSSFGTNFGQVAAFRFGVDPNTGAAFLANPGLKYTRLGGTPVRNITKLTAAGKIDASFKAPTVNAEDFSPDVQIDGSGAVYVSGNHTTFGSTDNASIVRLRDDGTRDPNYSLGALPFSDKQASGVALFPDGSAYVNYYSGSFTGGYSFTNLVRLNPDGALNASFRLSNKLETSLRVNAFDGKDLFYASTPQIATAPAGRIYVFSSSPQETVDANGRVKLVRINSNGTEDPSVPALSFAAGEITRDSSGITGGSTGYLRRLAQTGDGGFLVLASVAPFPTSTGAPYRYRVIKLRADGSEDQSFASPSLTSSTLPFIDFPVLVDPGTGFQFQPSNGFYRTSEFPVSSAAMLPDGSVVMAGDFHLAGQSKNYLFAKFTATGALDASFNPPALKNLAQPKRPAIVTNVRVAPDGKIWLLGRFDSIGGKPAPGVARLNPGGSLDTTFKLTGVEYYDYLYDAADVVFADSSKAYLVGTFRRPGETVPFAVTRIIGPQGPSGVVNISTRLSVQRGENVLIGGFFITGDAPKKVILRALGPSLGGFAGVLQDPTLQLLKGQTVLGSNDDWRSTQQQKIIDTGIPPTKDKEAALIATLQPGAYTAIVSGKNGDTGIGLIEVYDLGTVTSNTSGEAHLANLSTRGLVQTGNDVLIGGFIVAGEPTKLIVRAIGPSLSSQGIGGALKNPTLDLVDSNGAVVRSNNDWRIGGQEQQIIATQVPPTDDRESAIVATLAPGAYTAIVRGNSGTTGVGLVELYVLP